MTRARRLSLRWRPSRSRRSWARRGMTLLEIVVAISVILVMSLIVMESMRNSIEFNALLSDRDAVSRQARVAMQRIRRDLQLAFLTPHQQVGDYYRTVFVGIDQSPMDQMVFASLAHQRIYRDSRESDQTEISIWGERAQGGQGEGYVLYHRESQRIDHLPDEGGVIYPLAYNVQQLNIRYLDARRQEWTDEWDTRNPDTFYRLPRAVEVALILLAPDPDNPRRTLEVPFATTVVLHYGERIPSPLNPFGGAGPLAGGMNPPGGGGRGVQAGGGRGGSARGGGGGAQVPNLPPGVRRPPGVGGGGGRGGGGGGGGGGRGGGR